MELIYLASPYNHAYMKMRQLRFEMARDVIAILMNQGKVIYSPIVHNHPIAIAHDLPRDFNYWSKFDFVMLSKCDALYVLCIEGWQQSVGVTAEIKQANELGLPIYYIDSEGVEQ